MGDAISYLSDLMILIDLRFGEAHLRRTNEDVRNVYSL